MFSRQQSGDVALARPRPGGYPLGLPSEKRGRGPRLSAAMLIDFFPRYAARLLLAGLMLLPLVGWGAWHAYDRRDNSVLGWLPERSPVTQAYREFLRDFGPDETILVSWEGCGLDDPRLERLAVAVEARIAAAAAGTEPRWFASVTTGTRLRDRIAEAARVATAEATNRLRGVLVGPDQQTTCCVITLHSLDDPARREAYAWVQAAAAEAAGLSATALRLTGDAVIGVAIDVENERTAGTWSNLAMGVGLLVACLSLGSLRLGVMVIVVAGICSIATEAVIWWTGGTMNMLVSLVPVVTFVLAISAAVHLAAYWAEEATRGGVHTAPTNAVAIGWQPGFVATLTTVLGLGSLCVSQVRPVWQFGLYGALGAGMAYCVVFTLLPALLQLFPPRRIADRGAEQWPRFTAAVRRLVSWHRLSTLACLAAMVLAAAGLSRIRTEVRPARFLPPQSRWIADLEWFNDHVAPFQTVDAVLAFDAPHTGLGDRAALIQEVEARLALLDDVAGGLSAATFLPDDLLGFGDRGQVRSVIRRGVIDGRLRRSMATLTDSGMVADPGDRQLWRISLQVANFTAARQQAFEGAVGEAVAAAAESLDVRPPAAVICTGGVPLVIAAQRELLDALLESFGLAFATIVAVLAVFLRSATAGVLAMIPNILPPVCVFGLLGWLGRPLDVGGMMTASVALGISVDDTAHLLTWFKRAGNAGATPRERIDAALARSAAPILRTSLILGLAFAVFAWCDFTPIAQFGSLLASLLALALVGDLVLLPALLAGPAGRLFGRGVQQDHPADDQQRAGQL